MKHLVEGVGVAMLGVAWMAGIVLAPGWWKLAGAVFPPYPIYLLVERMMQMWGLI